MRSDPKIPAGGDEPPATNSSVDDSAIYLAILEALAEVAWSSPDLVAPELDAIEAFVDASRPGEDAAWRNLKNAVGGDETHEC